MTMRMLQFDSGDLDRMRPSAFVRSVVGAARQGRPKEILPLFDLWRNYNWAFHGDDGLAVENALDDFYSATNRQWPKMEEIARAGERFMRAWSRLLNNFVLFLMENELRSSSAKPLAKRIYELEQTYARSGFPAMKMDEIEELLANYPEPEEYLEARRRLLALS